MNYKLASLVFLGLTILSCNSDLKFDNGKWKNSGGENITLDTRLNMTKDLIESQILINKSETEISKLLGSPARLHGNTLENTKLFPVQEVYGWGIDPEKITYIKIEFNMKGKVNSAELFITK